MGRFGARRVCLSSINLGAVSSLKPQTTRVLVPAPAFKDPAGQSPPVLFGILVFSEILSDDDMNVLIQND